jgi:hypothetical protein
MREEDSGFPRGGTDEGHLVGSLFEEHDAFGGEIHVRSPPPGIGFVELRCKKQRTVVHARS